MLSTSSLSDPYRNTMVFSVTTICFDFLDGFARIVTDLPAQAWCLPVFGGQRFFRLKRKRLANAFRVHICLTLSDSILDHHNMLRGFMNLLSICRSPPV